MSRHNHDTHGPNIGNNGAFTLTVAPRMGNHHHNESFNSGFPFTGIEGRIRNYIGLAIVIIVLMVVVLIIVSIIVSNIAAKIGVAASYRAAQTSGRKELVHTLVYKVAPKVTGRIFDKSLIDGMVGYQPEFDQTIYFHFKRLLSSNMLTEARLMTAISEKNQINISSN